MSDLFDLLSTESLFPENEFSMGMDVPSATPQATLPTVLSVSHDYEEVDKLLQSNYSFAPFEPQPQLISPLRHFLGENFQQTEFAVSPSKDETHAKWENELEHLIHDFDRQELPIDQTLSDELVNASVKEFHARCKSLSLDTRTIQFLNGERKKIKNRQAAIRSRARKEERVTLLERSLAALQRENAALKEKLRAYESKN